MSGSLTWRTYNSDAGAPYNVFRDESNAESTTSSSASATLLSAFTSGANGLPSNIKPRYVNAQLVGNPTVRKKFIVGTLAVYNAIGSGTTITENSTPTQTWTVTSKVGEKVRIPTSVDTGQTDGDPV